MRTKKLSRREMLKLSSVAFAGSALAACGTEATQEPDVEEPTSEEKPADAVPSEKTKVSVWTGFEQGRMGEAMRNAVQRFNEKQDKFEAEHTVVAWSELRTKVVAATAAGNPPDAYRGWAWIVGDDGPLGGLTDLTPYVEATPNFNADDFWPGTLEQMKYDGKYYGMSISSMVILFFYNKGLLQEAGISTDQLPEDLEGWEEIAHQLYEVDGNSLSRIGFAPWIPFFYVMGWGATRNMDFWNPESKKIELDMDKAVDLALWHKSYADRYGVEELQAFMSSFSGNNYGRNTPEGVYYTGKLAIWGVESWLYNDMKEYGPDVDFGITTLPIPQGMDGKPGQLNANLYLVPTGAENPDGGFEFAHFMSSDPWVALNKAIPDAVTPSRKSNAFDPEVEAAGAPWLKVARDEILPFAYPKPSMPAVGAYETELQNAINRVMWEDADPETAIQEAIDIAQATVDERLSS